MDWVNRVVESLEPDELFVFGSNAQGFHGAGSAGLALRGDSRNNWRQDAWFLDAIAGKNDGVGLWAVFGVARGLQTGREGRSFAIQTVTRPGVRRSVSRREIYYQLVELWQFLDKNPQIHALVTPLGEGYAGYTRAEMEEVWNFLFLKQGQRNTIFCRPGQNYT